MVPTQLIPSIKEEAKRNRRTIVLPDSLDERTIQAAGMLSAEAIAHPILIGNEEQIRAKAQSVGAQLNGIRIIDPEKSDKLSDFSHIYFNLRKSKGIEFTQAQSTMVQPLYFGAMMVREKLAD